MSNRKPALWSFEVTVLKPDAEFLRRIAAAVELIGGADEASKLRACADRILSVLPRLEFELQADADAAAAATASQ